MWHEVGLDVCCAMSDTTTRLTINFNVSSLVSYYTLQSTLTIIANDRLFHSIHITLYGMLITAYALLK